MRPRIPNIALQWGNHDQGEGRYIIRDHAPFKRKVSEWRWSASRISYSVQVMLVAHPFFLCLQFNVVSKMLAQLGNNDAVAQSERHNIELIGGNLNLRFEASSHRDGIDPPLTGHLKRRCRVPLLQSYLGGVPHMVEHLPAVHGYCAKA